MDRTVTTAFLFFACLMAASFQAEAQSHTQPGNTLTMNAQERAHWSPSLGVTAMQLQGGEFSGNTKSGISVGISYLDTTPVADLSYDVGLSYLPMGAQIDAFFAKYEINLDYIALPLGLRYQLNHPQAEGMKWFLKAGVVPTALVSAKEKLTVLGESQENNIKDQLASTDVLLTAGVATSYSMSGNQILVDLDYLQGTTKVSSELGRNQGLMAKVGVSFDM